MNPLPWRYVEDWACVNCGQCCRGYNVVLSFPEWVNIVRTYGLGATESSLNRFFLGKKIDGTCLFLNRIGSMPYCTLQSTKPRACKIWPFKVLSEPKYGGATEASYDYANDHIYVYVDTFCSGVRWGTPSRRLISKVLPEFLDIVLGLREKQVYTTGDLSNDLYSYTKPRYGRRLI